MRKISRSLGHAGALVLAGAAVFAAPVAAQASAVVPCNSNTLVTAISQANSARFATLVLSRGCDYVLGNAAAKEDGLPPVTGHLLILGSGGTSISRSTDTPAAFRIFDVAAGGTLTLVNLTVANGEIVNPNEGAGGIRDAGNLVLRHVRLTGNRSFADFGGALSVENGAHATISDSAVDGSFTDGVGAAIFNDGHLIIDRSTLTGNTATTGSGGAIYTNTGSTTRISRSVITHNKAQLHGGGIFNTGTLVLSGDRVTSNQATLGRGGGISNASSGRVLLLFTQVTSNTPDNCNPQGTIRGCRN